MKRIDMMGVLGKVGAVITNSHVVYTSGRHGSAYINKDAAYLHPRIISKLCLAMAQQFADDGIEIVIGPANGGIILSTWVAYHLSKLTKREVLSAYADKVGKEFELKRGYDQIVKGKRGLVVEDILTTGSSVRKVLAVARECGCDVVGLSALCNRGDVSAQDVGGVNRMFSLFEVDLESWEEKDCPLCKAGVAINTKVGKGKEFLERQRG